MEAAPQPSTAKPQENVRKYFREVMAQYKLPVVASKVLTAALASLPSASIFPIPTRPFSPACFMTWAR